MQCITETLFLAGVYDQLNLGGLACIEHLCRRAQTVVDAYAGGGSGKPNFGAAHLYTGGSTIDSTTSELRDLVSKRAEQDQKIHAVRAKLTKPPGGGEGDGEDDTADGAAPKWKQKKGKGPKAVAAE